MLTGGAGLETTGRYLRRRGYVPRATGVLEQTLDYSDLASAPDDGLRYEVLDGDLFVTGARAARDLERAAPDDVDAMLRELREIDALLEESPLTAMHYNALGWSMTEQLTVRLPRTLHQDLKRTANRMQRKPSEVVRLALRQFLHGSGRPTGPAGVADLLGSLESGVPDLAADHRRYVLESVERGR